MAIIVVFSVVEERMKHAGLISNPAAAEFRENPVEGLRLIGFFAFKLGLFSFLFPFMPLEAVYDEVINLINFKGWTLP